MCHLSLKHYTQGRKSCCAVISHHLKFSLFECSTSVKSIHVFGLWSISCHWSTDWETRSVEPNDSSAKKQKERSQSYFSLGLTQLLAQLTRKQPTCFSHFYSNFSCSVSPKGLIAINCSYTFEALFIFVKLRSLWACGKESFWLYDQMQRSKHAH